LASDGKEKNNEQVNSLKLNRRNQTSHKTWSRSCPASNPSLEPPHSRRMGIVSWWWSVGCSIVCLSREWMPRWEWSEFREDCLQVQGRV